MAEHWGKRQVNKDLLARLIKAKPTKPPLLAKSAGIGKTTIYAMLRGEEVGFDLIEKVIAKLEGVVTPLGEKAENLLAGKGQAVEKQSSIPVAKGESTETDLSIQEPRNNHASYSVGGTLRFTGTAASAKEVDRIREVLSQLRGKLVESGTVIESFELQLVEERKDIDAYRVLVWVVIHTLEVGDLWRYYAVKVGKYWEFVCLVNSGRYIALLDTDEEKKYGELIAGGEGSHPPHSIYRDLAELFGFDDEAFEGFQSASPDKFDPGLAIIKLDDRAIWDRPLFRHEMEYHYKEQHEKLEEIAENYYKSVNEDKWCFVFPGATKPALFGVIKDDEGRPFLAFEDERTGERIRISENLDTLEAWTWIDDVRSGGIILVEQINILPTKLP